MNTKLKILLAASLAFNVVFVVFAYVLPRPEPSHHSRSPAQRAQMMAETLGLDADQQAVYEQMMVAHSRLRESRSTQRDTFYAELIKEDPDEKVLIAYLTSSSSDQQRLAMVSLLQKFVDSLTTEQRRMFVETVKDRHSSGRRPKR